MQIACVIVGQTPRCVSDSRALEERLFTLNASARKHGAYQNRAANELGCHWLRTSAVKKEGETERKLCNEIAFCHTKQEQQVKLF